MRLTNPLATAQDFKGGMVDNIPEGALDVWAERCVLLFERFGLAHVDQVPSRLLQLNSASTSLTVHGIPHSFTST